jgi:hypothetical protein
VRLPVPLKITEQRDHSERFEEAEQHRPNGVGGLSVFDPYGASGAPRHAETPVPGTQRLGHYHAYDGRTPVKTSSAATAVMAAAALFFPVAV